MREPRGDTLKAGGGMGCPERTALPEVIAIFGPTASGKTAVAEAVADRLGTAVVSADAMQVYRGLPILTNQPKRPSRLVAIRELSDEMSVAEYAELAHEAIDDLVARTGGAVVAGGTGLYLRAALVDLHVPPRPPEGVRERWERMYDADSARAHSRLAELDPEAAARVHPNDRRRIVRALELAELGSSLVPSSGRLWSDEVRRPTLLAGLDVPTAILEDRIRSRVVDMVERGALKEARSARSGPLSRTAARALGIRELTELPLAEAIELLGARTIRYAAYQRKWMRRVPGIVMIDADRSPEEVADALLEVARAR